MNMWRKVIAEKGDSNKKISRIQGCDPNEIQIKKMRGNFYNIFEEMVHYLIDLS